MFSAFTGRDGQKPFCVEDDDLVKVINKYNGYIEGPNPAHCYNWSDVVAYEIIEKAEKKRKIEFLIDEIRANTKGIASNDINQIVDFLYEEDYLDNEEIERCMGKGNYS